MLTSPFFKIRLRIRSLGRIPMAQVNEESVLQRRLESWTVDRFFERDPFVNAVNNVAAGTAWVVSPLECQLTLDEDASLMGLMGHKQTNLAG